MITVTLGVFMFTFVIVSLVGLLMVARRELVATRRYLQERDELRIWTSMGVYNQAIADAELWRQATPTAP